jgi:hypothetical protein
MEPSSQLHSNTTASSTQPSWEREKSAPSLEFAMLAEREPRLWHLQAMAERIVDDGSMPYFCANAAFYGYGGYLGIKPLLSSVVGWGRPRTDGERDPRLGTSRGYDVVYAELYRMLPSCRNCGCISEVGTW